MLIHLISDHIFLEYNYLFDYKIILHLKTMCKGSQCVSHSKKTFFLCINTKENPDRNVKWQFPVCLIKPAICLVGFV